MSRVFIAWSGLPDYAARCIRAFIERCEHEVTVIGTHPDVPIEGTEHSLGQAVVWIDGQDVDLGLEKVALHPPDILFCGGYSIPAFRSLTAACNRSGIPVVLLSDNYLEESLLKRLALGVWHRLFLSRRYRGVLVPGEAGSAYARAMGYRPEVIQTGLYSADPVLFHDGRLLAERPKRFLFVGRFIDRKNVLGLAEAFARFAEDHPDWELHLCGSGPQCDEIPAHPRIVIHDFVQPPDLARMMREARCLILPSLSEHFGLVVHEAALSGCALALSRNVGASADLATEENAVVFPARDIYAIRTALLVMAGWSDSDWNRAGAVSRERAARMSPAHFVEAMQAFVKDTVI